MTSQLLINEPPLQVLPTLASIIGLNEAIVLQQIHYWLRPQMNRSYFEGRYWVHNTYEQWPKQFPFLSERTLRRTVKNLEDSKLLLSCKGGKLNETKYYTIDYDVLQDACLNSQKGIPKEAKQRSILALERNPGVEKSLEDASNDYPEPDVNLQNQGNDDENQRNTSHSLFPWEHTQEGQQAEEEIGQHSLKLTKNNVVYPNWPKWPDHGTKVVVPFGQIGKLSSTETTTEITRENNTPPLLLSLQVTARAKKEKEEEEKINFLPLKPSIPSLLPCEQMLEVWNRTVQNKLHPGKDMNLTFKRKQQLETLLQNVLNGKLESWQDYCALIAGSKFLMGNNPNGFRATLDWACLPDNAYKVLEGKLYGKPEVSNSLPKELSWEEFESELARTLSWGPYLLPWLKISVNLARLMGQQKYRCCFATVSLKELTQTTAIFSVDNEVIRDSLIRNYSSYIRCAVASAYPSIKEFEFEVCPPEAITITP